MNVAGLALGGTVSGTGTTAADATAAEKAEDAGTLRKLTDAAQKFEAMFLQEMLKPLKSGTGGDDEDKDKDASAGSDTMSSYGVEAMADAIAKGGGVGVARQIVAKVSLERMQHSIRKS